MAAPSIEPSTRPRPQPGPRPVPQQPPEQPPEHQPEQQPTRPPVQRRRRRGSRTSHRQDTVQAAGNAIVAAARVGRILGRSGWRIARQLPGVSTVEHQAQRAVAEMTRRINPEEERAVRLAAGAATDAAPLRTAMSELLARSAGGNPARGHDYLFGTIMSQLVPDEARIIAALAGNAPFAAVDVVARKDARTLLGNVSTVTLVAAVGLPGRGPTYLDRLDGFGLLEFAGPPPGAEREFAALAGERAVQSAVRGGARVVRKSVTLSPLGREFWAACSPARR